MRRIVLLQDDGTFRLNLDFFRHHKEKIEYEWENGAPHVGNLFSSALPELLGPARQKGDELTQRHKDIARSVQAMYEEAFFHLLAHLHWRYKLDALCLAGGCAMNSVATRKGGRGGRGGGVVPGAHGGGPARARHPLDRLRSAARRHEGAAQRQDQA